MIVEEIFGELYNILSCDVIQRAESLLPGPGLCAQESVEQILGLVPQRLRRAALETIPMDLEDSFEGLLTDFSCVEALSYRADQQGHLLRESLGRQVEPKFGRL